MSDGFPVCVISFAENAPGHTLRRRHLRFKRTVFKEIISKCPADCPISIIAIAGPTRRGKSFVLSCIVKYLKALEEVEDDGQVGDWIGTSCNLSEGGFKFESTTKPITKGIWFWSVPFIVQIPDSPNKSKMAILLMDTQGCFDSFTNEAEDSAIVGLSLLGCSTFIYNDSLQINENVLSALAKFMRYGQLASQQFNEKYFQNLMFLIRDWNSPIEYNYGAAGGNNFIMKHLTDQQEMSPEALENRKAIRTNFNDYNCYLMPHPGKRIFDKKFAGDLADLDNDFREHLEKFSVAIVTEACAKKVPGTTENMSGQHFLNLLSSYLDVFNSNEMPSPDTVLRATVMSAYESHLSQQVQLYRNYLQEKIDANPFLIQTDLEKLHSYIKNKALEKFSRVKSLTNDQNIKANFTRRLHFDIEESFKELSLGLKEKQQRILGKAQEDGVKIFNEIIEGLIGTDVNRFWFRDEFEKFSEKAETAGMEEFLKVCGHPLDDQFVLPFDETLKGLKGGLWDHQENLHREAQQKIDSILHVLKSDYIEDMKLRIEGIYILPDKLVEWHQKLFNNCLESWNKNRDISIYRIEFVTNQEAKLKSIIEVEFHRICIENEDRAKSIKSSLDQILQEALALFSEAADKIFSDLRTADSAKLVEKHDKIVDIDTFLAENYSDYPLHFCKEFKNQLKISMKASLDSFLDKLANSEEKKRIECEKVVMKFSQSYSEKVNQLSLKFIQDSEEQLDIAVRLKSIEETLRPEFETQIRNFNCQGEVTTLLLSEIGKIIKQQNEQAVKERQQKIQAARTKTDKIFQTIIHNCEIKLKDDSVTEMDDNQFQYLKDKLCHDAEKTLREGVFNREILREFQKEMKLQLATISNRQMEEIRRLRNNMEEVLREVLEEAEKVYNEQLRATIDENPFRTTKEVELKERKIFDKNVDAFRKKITPQYQKSPQRLTDVVTNLKGVLSARKQFISQLLQEAKTEAEGKIFTAKNNHLDQFRFKLSKLPVNRMSVSEFDQTTTTLIEEVSDQFEQSWLLLEGGQKKEESMLELRNQMRKLVRGVQESQEVKDAFADQVISTLLASCCSEQVDALTKRKFLSNQELHSQWDVAIEEAKRNLTEQLQERGVDVAPKMGEFVEKSVDKLEELKSLNVVNFEDIKSTTVRELTAFRVHSEPHIKSLDGLKNFKRELKDQSLVFAKANFMGSQENFCSYEEILIGLGKVIFDQVILALKQRNDGKSVKVIDLAKKKYKEEMNKLMRGSESVHPDYLAEFNGRSLMVAGREIRKKYVTISDSLNRQVGQALENSYRILRDTNNAAHDTSTSSAIGIDLGTTTSCVSVMKDGKPVVIKDGSGNSLTPSYVHYPAGGGAVVGQTAKEQAQLEPECVVYDAKRLIGRLFTDNFVQEDMKVWPFKVIPDENNKPQIEVRGVRYCPEEVSGQVLMRMKKIAEDFLHNDVTEAVITVPANFSDSQRDATRQAAQVAGLKVLQIINEPTAAAIAHSITWNDEEKIVLVFDFGGGTFDVSILKSGGIKTQPEEEPAQKNLQGPLRPAPNGPFADERIHDNGGLQVLTTDGDTHLGGEDVDANIIKYCVQQFELENNEIKLLDIPDEAARVGPNTFFAVKRRQRRLKNECERVKVALTTAMTATVTIDAIYGDMDLNLPITREKFEQLNLPLFDGAIGIVQRAMMEAGVTAEKITDVILVGGSSRILKVRSMLEELLGKHNISIDHQINIQESVAMGAAIQASVLSGETLASKMVVKDVQTFSLGIEVVEGKMHTIIPRNTQLPCKGSANYVTTEQDQDRTEVFVYSGENQVAVENSLLGSFIVTDIPKGRAGSQKIQITMEVDTSGILNVSATCLSNHKTHNLVIKESRGRLSEDEIVEMRERASFWINEESEELSFF